MTDQNSTPEVESKNPPSDIGTTPPPPDSEGGGTHDDEVRRAGYDADAVAGDAEAYRPD